jgi:hypothetical protein
MRKLNLVMILMVFLFVCSCCEKIDKGPFPLRKVVERQRGEISGFFIFGTGFVDGNLDQTIVFAAATIPGLYEIFQMRIKQVKVKIDNKTSTPIVYLHFVGNTMHADLIGLGIQPLSRVIEAIYNGYEYHLIGATIVCNDSQWPSSNKINILE